MKNHLQTNSNNQTGNLIVPVLFILALMLVSQFCGAQTAYITNWTDSTASVINVATNTVIGTIKVGYHPEGISVNPDGNKAYVANFGSNTVSVIKTATNVVSATIPVGTSPRGVFVSPDGSKVYVANNIDNTVSVINTASNTVAATITVGIGPWGVSASRDGSKLYVANNGVGSVSVIKTATNTILDTIAVGIWPTCVSVSPDGSKVYVTNVIDGTVSVINTAADTVSATITVGTYPNVASVSPDGSKVYVTNYGDRTVSVINTATNTVSDTIKVGVGPLGASVSPDGSKVYVANDSSSIVSVINAVTNTISATIAVGKSPAAFGNFISTYTHCNASFSIEADTTQLHHYIATNNASGKQPIKYVWSWGDGSHDTIPYPSHTYADSGFYNICLSITDSSGCQSTFCDSSFHALRTTNTMVYVDVVNPLITGTKEVSLQTPQLVLFPNPATNQLTIHTSSFHNEAVTVSVMNVLGQETSPPTPLHMERGVASIDVSGLPSGLYFLQLKSSGASFVKKFVKQ